jgi:hypothetical protein
MVITTMTLVVIFGAMSLVFDVGNIYFKYVALRVACDSAALAGATFLPSQVSAAKDAANTFALTNGMTSSEVQSITVASDDLSITVNGTRSVPSLFAAVLGIKQFLLSANATAAAQPAGTAVSGTIPVGLQYTTPYSLGQTITMHSGGSGPGNWGGLALGGTGGTVFRDNLVNGYQGQLSIGDQVASEPGAKVGPTDQGIATRVADGLLADPAGTWDAHSLADPRVVLVPLVDWSGCNGSCTVPIKGFAQVWITGAAGADILGIFVGQAVNGSASPGAPQAGAFHVALVK